MMVMLTKHWQSRGCLPFSAMSHGELAEILYRQAIPAAVAGRFPGDFAGLDSNAPNFLLLLIEDGQYVNLEALEFELLRFFCWHCRPRLVARDLNGRAHALTTKAQIKGCHLT